MSFSKRSNIEAKTVVHYTSIRGCRSLWECGTSAMESIEGNRTLSGVNVCVLLFKVSSHSRKFEFKVFSIVHLNDHTF